MASKVLLRGAKLYLGPAGKSHGISAYASISEKYLESLLDHEKTGVPDGAGQTGQTGFNLAKMHRLLHAMKSPQKSLKVVHIAGSKGKGSVAAMLSSILHQAGLKVGTYTSPHTTTIHERIAINLQQIDYMKLDSLVQKWQPTIGNVSQQDSGPLSHFEVLTAIMLSHFAEHKVDIAVIEAGLGGISDATNVFGNKQLVLAVITTLGLEHQAALGNSLEEIAQAKAGICKKGIPLLIGPQTEGSALPALKEAADLIGSPSSQASEVVRVRAGPINLLQNTALQDFQAESVQPEGDQLFGFEAKSRLIGKHQAGNAEVALAAAALLRGQGFPQITQASMISGLGTAKLAGRFQVAKLGLDKPWIVLDGAHTPASAIALSRTLREAFPSLPVGFVIAMADDKNHAGVMEALRGAKPHVVTFTSVPIAGGMARSAPPGMLAGHWQAASFDDEQPLRCRELMKTNMASALEATQREIDFGLGNAVLCITGSLHAVSAATQILL